MNRGSLCCPDQTAILEITGSSPSGIEDAVNTAIAKASETIRNMQWFEVVKRATIDEIEIQARRWPFDSCHLNPSTQYPGGSVRDAACIDSMKDWCGTVRRFDLRIGIHAQ